MWSIDHGWIGNTGNPLFPQFHADLQLTDFVRVSISLFIWVPWNLSTLQNEVSTQVLVSTMKFFVIYECKMIDSSVIYKFHEFNSLQRFPLWKLQVFTVFVFPLQFQCISNSHSLYTANHCNIVKVQSKPTLITVW